MESRYPLLVLSGPSGVGKGRLCQLLLASEALPFTLSVSTTSRQPRVGEQNGVHYHFVDKARFEEEIAAGCFYEWAEFNGNYYGTSKDWVRQEQNAGKVVILEIETQGAFQIKEQEQNACLIFVEPPSMMELERRLRERGTETEAKIQERLALAKHELKLRDRFDVTVCNNDLQACCQAIIGAYRQWVSHGSPPRL